MIEISKIENKDGEYVCYLSLRSAYVSPLNLQIAVEASGYDQAATLARQKLKDFAQEVLAFLAHHYGE